MKIFKELTIGGLEKGELLQRLIDAGIRFNKYAETLFDHPSFCPSLQTENVKLVKLKLSELGISGACSYQSIIDQAACLDLKLCPAYLAAFLRLEYMDQPEGPYLTIASPRIEIDENHPTGFYIRNNDNSLWLRGDRVSGDADWPPENEFIFLAK